jgi:hypothetical protein
MGGRKRRRRPEEWCCRFVLDESESFKTFSKTGVDERGTREMEMISYGGLAGKAKNAAWTWKISQTRGKR